MSSQPPAQGYRGGYPTASAKPHIPASVRFTPDMAERLRIIAYQTGRTKGYLIQFAVEQYLDIMDKRADGAGAA